MSKFGGEIGREIGFVLKSGDMWTWSRFTYDEDEGEGQYVPISSVRCHIEFPTKGSAMRELELVIVARLAKYGTRERFLHS